MSMLRHEPMHEIDEAHRVHADSIIVPWLKLCLESKKEEICVDLMESLFSLTAPRCEHLNGWVHYLLLNICK